MRGIRSRLGLDRPELVSWALYDWANSAMVTIVVASVFPIYFLRVAGADLPPAVATQRFAIASTIGLALVAVMAPILGVIADRLGIKKRLLGASMVLGVASVAGMFFIGNGDWLLAAVLLILAEVGAGLSFVFYDALLPHVAKPEEMDRVSAAAYALGYVGGGSLLAVNLAWIQWPWLLGIPSGEGITEAQATLPARLAFLSVAIWWVLFSIPLFLRVSEPPAVLGPEETDRANPVRVAFRRLGRTLRALRGYREAFVMLLAFLLYNDGIGTIIKMAAIFGAEIGIGQGAMLASILLVQFVGIPFTFLFGMLADRIGAKRAILLGLVVYTGISMLGYLMTSASHFFLLAILIGMVQGGSQALSRSLFASLIPKPRSGEFFGFFAIAEKFAGILGPACFAAVIAVTGSSRSAILSVIIFFLVGGGLLALVDVELGRKRAREEERELETGERMQKIESTG
ncbi:MFS transporter [Tautonia rosea]|uniref:MFS transporter n=1 Tax=Tautonia rosea TaxID=2728037 RepID=UPI0019CFCACF|nr:MFS transporter [Tautonia rosea]